MAARMQDLGELILNYDPVNPQPHFFSSASALALARALPALPVPVPWPAGGEPIPAPPSPAPTPEQPLPRCDVLVVTWTVAEARALARLFTPGVSLEDWFAYTHKVADFIPKVTGPFAPSGTVGGMTATAATTTPSASTIPAASVGPKCSASSRASTSPTTVRSCRSRTWGLRSSTNRGAAW